MNTFKIKILQRQTKDILYSSQYFIKVKIITISIFLPNRNIIKKFKDFKNLKPDRNLNIFHKVSIQTSQKTENKFKKYVQKVCIYHKKYLKLQFQLQINMAS